MFTAAENIYSSPALEYSSERLRRSVFPLCVAFFCRCVPYDLLHELSESPLATQVKFWLQIKQTSSDTRTWVYKLMQE